MLVFGGVRCCHYRRSGGDSGSGASSRISISRYMGGWGVVVAVGWGGMIAL